MQVYSTHTVLLHTTLFDRKRFNTPTHQANRIPSNLCSTCENRKKNHNAFWILEPHLTSKEAKQ